MTIVSKWLSMASLLVILGAAGLPALAQMSPPASHGRHHPDAAGAPAMPIQGGGMGMPMMGGMMEHMSAMQMMRDRPEGRLAFLKAELAITDPQLPQWNAYAEAVRAEAKGHGGGAMMGRGPGASAATWPDRLSAQEVALQQRLDSVRRMKVVATALYAVLGDEQKRTADELIRGPMGGM